MNHRIARLVEPLLHLLVPGRGRHRRIASPVVPQAPAAVAAPPAVGRDDSRVLRGEDNAMVRPYLVAHERRAGRRVLRLAVHGVEVAA
ncbi:hypothetical protein ACFYY3_08905 [Streptomyces sp. NPDC001812]|uniref:hypothetical protein n=1 Tax=unclassified Streptomyces TaxID=2593676 RepID=UPI003666E3BC